MENNDDTIHIVDDKISERNKDQAEQPDDFLNLLSFS
jgi:hypothetical protein